MRRPRTPLVAVGALVALLSSALPGGAAGTPAHPAAAEPWHVSWATAQHVAGPAVQDQSLRMITHLSQGGDAVRLRLGNALGSTGLQVGAVTVGVRSTGAAVVPGTLRPVTFGGSAAVVVPAGGTVVSDPVRLDVQAQQDLAVSIALPGAATPSAHREAFQTSFLTPAGAGDRTAEESGASYTRTTEQLLVVDAVDVRNPRLRGAVVVVGGSVVDGSGSRRTGVMGTGPGAPADSRWSDVVARRVLAGLPADEQLSIANAGVGGNAVSRACNPVAAGNPFGNVQDRLDRDVLAHSGVRTVVFYAGTNDLGIGTGCSAEQIVAGFQDVLQRSREAGLRTVVSTVTARASYTPLQNEQRQLVNRWIVAGCDGACDATLDFDAVTAWSAYPNALDPRLDAGDTIHPNAEGYRLMGESIDLRLLTG